MAYIGQAPTNVPLTSADLEDNIITSGKLNNDIISGQTALATSPADTDEFLISDAGVLKRLDASLVGGGKLLQIATVNFAGDVNTTSTSLVKVSSNFEVSLTPSATSSKILIMMGNGNAYVPTGREMKVHMYRKIGSGSLTAMTVSDVDATTGDIGNVYRSGGSGNQLQVPHSFNYLDSPNTTSTVTYAPYFRSNSSDAVYFNTPDGNPWVINLTIIEVGA